MTCLRAETDGVLPVVYWRPLWSTDRTVLVQLFFSGQGGPIELATVAQRRTPCSPWGPTITLETDPEESTGGHSG